MSRRRKSAAQQPRAKGSDYYRHPTDLYRPVYEAIDRARAGDGSGLDVLIQFLESDAYTLGSGYLRSDAIRAVTRLELGVRARQRLHDILLAAINGRTLRELRTYGRLARRLDSPELRAELESAAKPAPESPSTRHARWMLDALDAGGRLPGKSQPG